MKFTQTIKVNACEKKKKEKNRHAYLLPVGKDKVEQMSFIIELEKFLVC